MHRVCTLARACVCVCEQALHGGRREQRYLFALLRGPSVHVSLEAKNVCSLSAGDGPKVRATRFGRTAHRLAHQRCDYAEIRSDRFCCFLALQVQPPSLLLAPPSLPAVVGFCTLILVRSLSLSLWPHELSLCGLFASNQYESCASSKHKQPPFFLLFFVILCAVQIFTSSHVNLCVFPLFLGKNFCPPKP